MSETYGLNDVMEGGVPRRNSNVFDISDGKGLRKVEPTDPTIHNTTNSIHQPAPTTGAPARQVVPVSTTGPIDMNNVTPVDIDSILPRREKTTEVDNELMRDLDIAVDREIASITERHDQLFEAQQKEFEEKEAAAEEEAMKADDEFATSGIRIPTSTTNSDDYADDFYGVYSDSNADTPNIGTRFSAFGNESDNASEKAVLNENKSVDIYGIPDDGKTDNAPKVVDANDKVEPAKEDIDQKEAVSDPSEPVLPKNVLKPINVPVLDNVDNDHLFDDEDDAENDDVPSSEEVLETLKTQVRERLGMSKIKKLDLSRFSIAQKAISAQKVMKLAVQQHQNAADWIMPNAGRPITVTGLSGPEILKLNPENSNRNKMNTFRDMYRVIYDHIIDGNKPEFEAWLKITRFADLPHIQFALYMATFGGSNFTNYTCPKCHKTFIHDIPSFEDMIMYANEEAKTKVKSILKMDTTSTGDDYKSEIVAVSDQYAFALRTPSVWNVVIETASLSDKFLETYADQIDMIAYIDAAYLIDQENFNLIPIDTKPDPDDITKTAGRRIRVMHDLINKLDSQELYALRSAINALDESDSTISYKIPGCTCPECKADVPGNNQIGPDGMLFTRHQLAAIASM